MKSSTFIQIAKGKTDIQQIETAELKSVIEEFPYFQAARALYLKGLKNQDSFKYNNELKLTAAYTTDRTVLFNYITSFKSEVSKEETIHEQISSKLENNHQKETILSVNADEETNTTTIIDKAEENLEIGKPLSFSNSESHSFQQWLQLSTKKQL